MRVVVILVLQLEKQRYEEFERKLKSEQRHYTDSLASLRESIQQERHKVLDLLARMEAAKKEISALLLMETERKTNEVSVSTAQVRFLN